VSPRGYDDGMRHGELETIVFAAALGACTPFSAGQFDSDEGGVDATTEDDDGGRIRKDAAPDGPPDGPTTPPVDAGPPQVCTGGVGCTCSGPMTCNITCANSCTVTCSAGSTCYVDCPATRFCTLQCNLGAMCACQGTGSCTCQGAGGCF
jgi:hypothetical protein